MAYTVNELKEKLRMVVIRKEQIQELCKRKDKDVFDITYNVTAAYIKEWSPRLCQELQAICARRKQLDRNSSATEWEHNANYSDLSKEVEKYFQQVVEMIIDKADRL